MASEIKVDTISEKTSAGGVTIDGLLIKDGGISGDVALIGTTPTFTIGDAGAEDAALVFDGNAQDFHIGLDDSADDLVIGVGSTLGTTTALAIDENAGSTFSGTVTVGVDDTGKDVKFFGATSGSYALWDESADDLNLIASGLGVITAKDLGIGLHIRESDSGASVEAWADALVLEGSADSGMTICSGASSDGSINFADSGAASIGRITYNHNTNHMHFNTSSTEAMRIDSTGAVTKPLQPSFRATVTASQDDIAVDGWVDIVFGGEGFDTNGDFASNTFTAPVAGKYILTACIYFQNLDQAAASVSVNLNTSNDDYVTVVDPDTMYASDPAFITMNTSHLVDMDASDTAKIRVYFEGGSAQTDINTSSTFTGALVC